MTQSGSCGRVGGETPPRTKARDRWRAGAGASMGMPLRRDVHECPSTPPRQEEAPLRQQQTNDNEPSSFPLTA